MYAYPLSPTSRNALAGAVREWEMILAAAEAYDLAATRGEPEQADESRGKARAMRSVVRQAMLDVVCVIETTAHVRRR